MRALAALVLPRARALAALVPPRVRALAALVLLPACLPDGPLPPASWDEVTWEELTPLPEPVTNNAVTAGGEADDCSLYSFLGVGAGLDYEAVSNRGWCLAPGGWQDLGEVPGGVGRVAANAVTLGEEVVLLGGYSLAADGSEQSFDRVDAWLPWTLSWTERAPLPIAIDDAVVAAWRSRWIVVVSGWSQTDNVDAVQIYDSVTGGWILSDPFPGTPVFGASGAILGDDLLVVDGVASTGGSFELVEQAWVGHLSADGSVDWEDLGEHPGPARYRAAGGSTGERVVLHGGGAAAYDVDGLAYGTGQPVEPVPGAITWTPDGWGGWETPAASMDHRALATPTDRLVVVGGLGDGLEVQDAVWAARPSNRD